MRRQLERMTSKRALRPLTCILSEDEQRERGIELANMTAKFMDNKAAAKIAAKQFKDIGDDLNDKILITKDAVRLGREVRDVECSFDIDFTLGQMRITRLDTGDVIVSRPLTAEEAQGKFDFDFFDEVGN